MSLAELHYDEILDIVDGVRDEDEDEIHLRLIYINRRLTPGEVELVRQRIAVEQRRVGVEIVGVFAPTPKKSKGLMTLFSVHFWRSAEKNYVLEIEEAREFQRFASTPLLLSA